MVVCCPTCRQQAYLGEALGDTLLSLSDDARDVWDCVWQNAPHPVTAYTLFDYLYSDDPDGGPDMGKCYARLHAALDELDDKMAGAAAVVSRIGARKARWEIKLRPWLFRDQSEASQAA